MNCWDFQPKYTSEQIDAFHKMHTKQLLHERNLLYGGSTYCRECHGDHDECAECGNNREYNRTQLKAILDTREHVLNKQESKALRKARIKKGR